MLMVVSSRPQQFQDFTRFIWWMQFKRQVAAHPQTQPVDCIYSPQKKSTIWNKYQTRMWANAQRDGRPAEYRRCPLFNAAKFGWCPLLECRAVTLPRREGRWNLQGFPKLANRFQPLGGRSSPYYEDLWGRYRYLTCFSHCRYMPQLRRYSPTKLCDVAKMSIFASCIFSEQRAVHFRHAF